MTSWGLICAAMLASSASPAPLPWRDGSVLVLQDSNSVVSAVTDSRITHVAIVFQDGPPKQQRSGKSAAASWTVYEATPGKVRKLRLAEYLREIAVLNERRSTPMTVYALTPRFAYKEVDLKRMKSLARKSLGQRYSVKGYVRGKPADGVHCSEFACKVLSESARHSFREPHQVTPIRLRNALAYSHRRPVLLKLPQRPAASWCRQTSECWSDFWQWCGWACGETMRFCF